MRSPGEEEEEKEENEEEEEKIIIVKNSPYKVKFIGNLKGHEGPVTCLICTKDEKNIPILFIMQTNMIIILLMKINIL